MRKTLGIFPGASWEGLLLCWSLVPMGHWSKVIFSFLRLWSNASFLLSSFFRPLFQRLNVGCMAITFSGLTLFKNRLWEKEEISKWRQIPLEHWIFISPICHAVEAGKLISRKSHRTPLHMAKQTACRQSHLLQFQAGPWGGGAKRMPSRIWDSSWRPLHLSTAKWLLPSNSLRVTFLLF